MELFSRKKRPYEIVIKCESAEFSTVKNLENLIRKHLHRRYKNEDEFKVKDILSMEV